MTGGLEVFFFFFKNPPPTEFYPLPLPAALPISHADVHIEAPRDARAPRPARHGGRGAVSAARGVPRPAEPRAPAAVRAAGVVVLQRARRGRLDRKSTRLNSSHGYISYAVFCLKK